MASNEEVLGILASAILDGTPADWDSVNTHIDERQRPLVEQLKVLSEIAALHRSATAASTSPPDSRVRTLPTGATWGPLQILEKIGHGAFGDVSHDSSGLRLD